VLTTPQPLRTLLAYDAKLASFVGRCFVAAVFRFLRRQAKRELGLRSIRDAHPGAITAVQRFNSAALLSVHHHVLASDGVFVTDASGTPRFEALPAPSRAEVAQVAWSVCLRVVAELRKRGRFLDSTDDAAAEFVEREPALAACYSGSIEGTLVMGPKAGTRVVRLFGRAAGAPKENRARPGHGFDVHAGVRVSANDRNGLERLCRYLIRPPLSEDRVRLLPDGRVQVRLKRRWSDGTTHMVHDPLDFLTKLAALVPPPRVHLVRYSGFLAPHAKLRPRILELCRKEKDATSTPAVAGTKAAAGPGPSAADGCAERHRHHRRRGWAELLARVFAIDVLECPKCGTQGMQRIATITDGKALRAILHSVGLPADSPEPAPPRLPQHPELDFAS